MSRVHELLVNKNKVSRNGPPPPPNTASSIGLFESPPVSACLGGRSSSGGPFLFPFFFFWWGGGQKAWPWPFPPLPLPPANRGVDLQKVRVARTGGASDFGTAPSRRAAAPRCSPPGRCASPSARHWRWGGGAAGWGEMPPWVGWGAVAMKTKEFSRFVFFADVCLGGCSFFVLFVRWGQ